MAANERSVRVFREGGRHGRLLLDDGERLLDLSAHLMQHGQPTDLVDLLTHGWFAAGRLAPLLPKEDWDEWDDWTSLDVEWDGNAPEGVTTPLPVSDVGKILALGKNFRAHAEEFNEEVPDEPLFFNKLPETLVPHHSDVTVPDWYTQRVDHEAELAVVIAQTGYCIDAADAMELVGGYCVANDLTARSIQGSDRKKMYPWFRGKNLDGFCPLGPCFVPRDFLDISDLRVTAHVNGELRQDASTRDLVVDVPTALAWLSRHLTLRPGDIVLMGTPAGVGPLEDGDEVVCAVEGIGQLETTIRRPRGDSA
jgi:2-keto-4-pentenoate hydratase/2-oxohepta-3-ene-1,7-dioic acid hydratase in catechol pathway